MGKKIKRDLFRLKEERVIALLTVSMAGIQTVGAMSEAEIIDFVPPHENYKSLYISNISPSLNEDEIYVSYFLHLVFPIV